MAFRDSFDNCPRCGTPLEDAGAARGCRGCAGMFVEQPMLAEMILNMLPPPPRAYGPLALSEVKRGETLGCPQCNAPMKPTVIHEVELDHCAKHGVWFDQDELRLTLYRVADPSNPPPFGEWIKPPEPWEQPRAKLPPAKGSSPRIDPGARRLTFEIGGTAVETQVDVIKVGRLITSALRIEDEGVSRLHAVIEVTPAEIQVIDLGSAIGTLVNGARVTKATLNIGDVLRFGNTEVRLVGAT